MTRKKKNQDILEDAKEAGTSLYDFVITQKVDAFVAAYQPVDRESLATQRFDETRLRIFFKAYPCTLGDPLTIYLSLLEGEGFYMKVSTMNEPVILATERATESEMLKLDVL